MEFDNKVVIVTGASSGIGTACALHFAKLKAKLSLVGRNAENLLKVGNQCQQLNGFNPSIIIADISKEEDVDKIITETIETFGRIDVLVNNAGILLMANLQQGLEVFDNIMKTNIRGTIMLTEKVIPHLAATKGNIVNLSSVLSTRPFSFLSGYCMSKAAIDMYTKCAALELGSKGIRVNSVNPGAVRTKIFSSGGMSEETYESIFKFYKTTAPLKKECQVEDVANVVVFLASDQAKCVTGCCYTLDCGTLIAETILK